MKLRAVGSLALAMLCGALPALAQTGPGETPVDPDRFYGWVDTSFQSVGLAPVEDFGFQAVTPGPGLGGSERHDPRLSGYGLSAGVGYRLDEGVLPAAFGSNVRIELSGHYVDASGGSTAQSGPMTDVNLTALPFSGNMVGIAGCGSATCFTRSSLASDYANLGGALRIRGDFVSGAWAFTPSVGVRLSGGKVGHDLIQTLFVNGAPYPVLPPNLMQFGMNSRIDWLDYGVELGGDLSFRVTDAVSLGLKGTLGVVNRSASVSATSTLFFGASVPVVTTIGAKDTHLAAVANLEANLSVRLAANLVATGFAGLNYDSGVVGLAAPAIGVPAHLRFDPATSYYAGAALKASF